MDMESEAMLIMINMKVSGKIIKKMEKEYMNMLMVLVLRENGKMVKELETEFFKYKLRIKIKILQDNE